MLSSSSNQAIHLYRQLIRHACHMKDYNFRSYAIRRIKIGYEENRHLIPQSEEYNIALKEGYQQLEMLRRQSMLSQLYPSAQSVMESVMK